jgi:hypothetical protein
MMITLLVLLQAGVEDAAARVGEGIGTGALIFMLASMGAVLVLTAWCFKRVLSTRRHFDPDGTGPAEPPVRGEADRR